MTVSLEDDESLSRTVESVKQQAVPGVEHLVVLGSNQESARVTSASYRTIYEPPRGVYSAMNAGLRESVGLLTHYLNAGDTYAGPDVLATVKAQFEDTRFTWAFGRLLVSGGGRYDERLRGASLDEMQVRGFRGRYIPEHPALFAQTELLRSLGGFDSSYTVAADYRLILQLIGASRGEDLGIPVTRFALGGVSDTHWVTSVRECHRARMEVIHPRGKDALLELAYFGRDFADQGIRRLVRPVVRQAVLRSHVS